MRRFVEGKPVDNPPTSIRLFALLDHMKWAHLPVEGGLLDQHPQFLEEIAYIFARRDEFQEKERKKREQEMKRNSPRVAGRR